MERALPTFLHLNLHPVTDAQTELVGQPVGHHHAIVIQATDLAVTLIDDARQLGVPGQTPDRAALSAVAMDEAHRAATTLAQLALNCIVIDISPRPREEAAQLAEALDARYLPLPPAQSAAMVAAIESLGNA